MRAGRARYSQSRRRSSRGGAGDHIRRSCGARVGTAASWSRGTRAACTVACKASITVLPVTWMLSAGDALAEQIERASVRSGRSARGLPRRHAAVHLLGERSQADRRCAGLPRHGRPECGDRSPRVPTPAWSWCRLAREPCRASRRRSPAETDQRACGQVGQRLVGLHRSRSCAARWEQIQHLVEHLTMLSGRRRPPRPHRALRAVVTPAPS